MFSKRKEIQTFGKRLKAERQRLGLTQTAFAERGGVSKVTQGAYESDSTRPDVAYLSRLADAGVDILWITTGRRASPGIDWDLIDELLELIDEWASERKKTPSRAERKDLLRVLYSQFIQEGRIDTSAAAAVFRLAK
jgi:transcriptional regulator with XRE-family HTH domain